MGYIVNNFYRPDDLYNDATGLVSFITETENDFSDPQIYVVASQTADIRSYGFPHKASSNGSGAAITYAGAYMAALGEAVERYALSIIHCEDLILSSYSDLVNKGNKVVDISYLSMFDFSQTDGLPFEKLEKNTPIAWIKTESLTSKEIVYVPASLAYIPYFKHFEELGEQITSLAVSTGAACGDSLLKSILGGIRELIERDAFMICWRNRLKMRKVIFDKESNILSLINEKFARPGIKIDIYYTTLDLEMPSFFGVLTDQRGEQIGRVVGGAAHSHPNVAITKTLVELVQGLKWKDHKNSEGQNSFDIVEDFTNVRSFENRMELYSLNDLSEAFDFLKDVEEIEFSAISNFANSEEEELKKLLDLFKKMNYDVLAVDITPLEAFQCRMYVTKVFIPQLETMEGDHTMPFLTGLRWKKVPVELNLINEETTIEKINPFPHPYP